MRAYLAVTAISAAIAAFDMSDALAQSAATYITHEEFSFGPKFLSQPPGTAGIVIRNGCNSRADLTGTRTYLVKNSTIYWGLDAECIRVVVNHRGSAETNIPTYLGVQIVGLYESPPDHSVVLRRKGLFGRLG